MTTLKLPGIANPRINIPWPWQRLLLAAVVFATVIAITIMATTLLSGASGSSATSESEQSSALSTGQNNPSDSSAPSGINEKYLTAYGQETLLTEFSAKGVEERERNVRFISVDWPANGYPILENGIQFLHDATTRLYFDSDHKGSGTDNAISSWTHVRNPDVVNQIKESIAIIPEYCVYPADTYIASQKITPLSNGIYKATAEAHCGYKDKPNYGSDKVWAILTIHFTYGQFEGQREFAQTGFMFVNGYQAEYADDSLKRPERFRGKKWGD